MSDPPAVWIVVLNYNGIRHLHYCLPSLLKTTHPNTTLLLVDNASTDESVNFASSQYPEISLVRNASNFGWSAGNNAGIRVALQNGAEYVALANNDIEVDPRWVSAALEVCSSDPSIGIVGFDVVEANGDIDHSKAAFALAQESWRTPEVTDERYVGGMAMMISARVLRHIGLIDEHFFVYGEENDLQIRARRAGYRVVKVDVPVWHYGQGTWGSSSLRASFHQTRNNIRLLLKHGTPNDVLIAAIRHVRTRLLRRPARTDSAVEQRLSSRGPLMNWAVLAWAFWLNMISIPEIIRTRLAEHRQVRRYRG